jgi:hypothetical protein
MQAITTIGLDIAKSVFQVHGVDAEGNVVLRRQLKRRYMLAFFQKLPPCLVGIEACASSHHWSRELEALGHTVRLMPPAYVKPYVKRHKKDATDAEAICEAVTRPNMRFVATKTPEQQSCLTLHRTRHLFIRQQTSVINAIRAHMAEFGIVAPVGRHGVEQLLGVAADANDKRLSGWFAPNVLAVTIRPPLAPRANDAMACSISSASRRSMALNSTPVDAVAWIAANWPIPAAIAGSRKTAARVTSGAISFRSSSHFAARAYSNMTKPVALPPGRERLATTPEPTGSMTPTNTIGTVRLACSSGVTAGVVEAKTTSGASATNSVAYS